MNHNGTISILKGLIATCNEGEYVFRYGVTRARSVELAMTFACLADNCQQGARELQRCVVRLGGPVVAEPRASSLLRGVTLAMRRVLAGDDDLALLEACRRVEELAVVNYRRALEDTLPGAVRVLVERHYRGVKLNHIRIRDLFVMHAAIGPVSYAGAPNVIALRSAPERAGTVADPLPKRSLA